MFFTGIRALKNHPSDTNHRGAMMFGGIGAQELLLIFLVVLLLFGAKRVPDIAHGLGKGIREFKRAMQSTQDELSRSISEVDNKHPDPPPTPPEPGPTGNKPPAGA